VEIALISNEIARPNTVYSPADFLNGFIQLLTAKYLDRIEKLRSLQKISIKLSKIA
jgi:hypothetical protein